MCISNIIFVPVYNINNETINDIIFSCFPCLLKIPSEFYFTKTYLLNFVLLNNKITKVGIFSVLFF